MSNSQEILSLLAGLVPAKRSPNGKWPVGSLGYVSCGNTLHIRHVPLYEPCVITVLAGRKIMYEAGRATMLVAGETVTVPAPASYDIRNEPDPRSGKYRALIIPFQRSQLLATMQLHQLPPRQQDSRPTLHHIKQDAQLLSSIRHYLDACEDDALRQHRLLEILLLLLQREPMLAAYIYHLGDWSNRVRAVIAQDLAHEWSLNDVCARLATSESTLRRHLQKEDTGFRELIQELRLSTALMQLLQTNDAINRIAYSCGFQSMSRFSNNFHKRFGLPPSQFRLSMRESEQGLAVSEHSPAA